MRSRVFFRCTNVLLSGRKKGCKISVFAENEPSKSAKNWTTLFQQKTGKTVENPVYNVENPDKLKGFVRFSTSGGAFQPRFCHKTQHIGVRMQVEKILSEWEARGLLSDAPENVRKTDISSVCCDSRLVIPGAMFFVKGVNFRESYLKDAFAAGASVCVAERKQEGVPCITVSDVRAAMPVAADVFYGHPSGKYFTVGVTGTKGKTTVSTMLKNIFDREYAGKAGLLCTNGAWFGAESLPKSGGSTPEALEFYGLMDAFARRGARAVCAEISSQALQYNRVTGTEFAVGVFLNLGSDHISATEHASFEEYRDAKKKLFSMCRVGVFNNDDPYAEEFMRDSSCKKKITVGMKKNADLQATDVLLTCGGEGFRLCGGIWDGEWFEIRIPGEFNVYNALCAIAVAQEAGCSLENVREAIRQTEVEGRMEIFTKNGITVLVDYAHNEISFEAVFSYIRRAYPGARILCLFGCQGNKALGRRTELPAVVEKYADYAILTSDDPEN